jgi:hypothetical protein
MALSGMELREAVANAPTIHEMALAILAISHDCQVDARLGCIKDAIELAERALDVPKQPLRY